MKNWIASILVLLVSYTAYAQEYTINVSKPKGVEPQSSFIVPEQKINAPATVDTGDMVMIDVSPVTNVPPGLIQISYKWKVLENGVEKTNVKIWPDGSSVVFGSGKRSGTVYTVVLSASYLYSSTENNKPTIGLRSNLLVATVRVGDAPGPGPIPPGPNPIPPGPLPPGKYDLANKTAIIASRINSPNKVMGCQAIATSLRGIASQISAKTLTDVKDILVKTKQANQMALQQIRIPPSDFDEFFSALQKEIYPLYTSGKLTTPDDFGEAYTEIVNGLNSVR